MGMRISAVRRCHRSYGIVSGQVIHLGDLVNVQSMLEEVAGSFVPTDESPEMED